ARWTVAGGILPPPPRTAVWDGACTRVGAHRLGVGGPHRDLHLTCMMIGERVADWLWAEPVEGNAHRGLPAKVYHRATMKYITSTPTIMGGAPVVVGSRVPIAVIVSLLEQGYTVEAINDEFPHVPL